MAPQQIDVNVYVWDVDGSADSKDIRRATYQRVSKLDVV